MSIYKEEDLDSFENKEIPIILNNCHFSLELNDADRKIKEQMTTLFEYYKYTFTYDAKVAIMGSNEIKNQKMHIHEIYQNKSREYIKGITNLFALSDKCVEINEHLLKNKWNYPEVLHKSYFEGLIGMYKKYKRDINNTIKYLDINLAAFYRKYNKFLDTIDSDIRAAERRENVLFNSDIILLRTDQIKSIMNDQKITHYKINECLLVFNTRYDDKIERVHIEYNNIRAEIQIQKMFRGKSDTVQQDTDQDTTQQNHVQNITQNILQRDILPKDTQNVIHNIPIISSTELPLYHTIQPMEMSTQQNPTQQNPTQRINPIQQETTQQDTQSIDLINLSLQSMQIQSAPLPDQSNLPLYQPIRPIPIRPAQMQSSLAQVDSTNKINYTLISSTSDTIKLKVNKNKSSPIKVRPTKPMNRRRIVRVSHTNPDPKQNPNYNEQYDKYFESRDLVDRIKKLAAIAKAKCDELNSSLKETS